jgi:hypothetical protein
MVGAWICSFPPLAWEGRCVSSRRPFSPPVSKEYRTTSSHYAQYVSSTIRYRVSFSPGWDAGPPSVPGLVPSLWVDFFRVSGWVFIGIMPCFICISLWTTFARGSLYSLPSILLNPNTEGLDGGTLYEVLGPNAGTGNVTVNATGFDMTCRSLPEARILRTKGRTVGLYSTDEIIGVIPSTGKASTASFLSLTGLTNHRTKCNRQLRFDQ